MKKPLHPPAYILLVVAMLLLMTRSTNAASLLVTSGQTMQLGLPGVQTNYSFTSVTVDAGGTLQIAGEVTLIVSSNVLINGQMTGGSMTAELDGMDGLDGLDGVLNGNVAEDGFPGDDAENGTNAFADAPSLAIFAKNMIVNGSILFNPEADASDGGSGGDGGKGADGLAGKFAGSGGPGGIGGNGGNSLGAPSLLINVVSAGGTLPTAGNFILGASGVISLDNTGSGGSGGDGGAGGDAGKGGNGAAGAPGGGGGNGGPSGFGGAGGTGAAGGDLSITALGIDLEGKISLKAGDGGEGGGFGEPKDGGNGGDGGATTDGSLGGRGGPGGNASDAFLLENPGGGGGEGGFGGNLFIEVTSAFTNSAEIDFSGGKGGIGGSGGPGGFAQGGTGGPGGSGAASGIDGQPSAAIPDGPDGIDGANGSMTVVNQNWGTQAPNGWQTTGNGILTFGFTNNMHTLIMTSTNGPFSVSGELSDPRLEFDSVAQEEIVETNVPVQLQFAFQWLTTAGSVDVLLGGKVVLHLPAPTVLSSSFSQASVTLTGLPAVPTDQMGLTFQLNTAGFSQFQLGNPLVQSLTQVPALSAVVSPADPTSVGLSWFGTTNMNYQVQSRTSFSSGGWTNLGAVIPGQGAASTVTLPVTSGDPIRFFRLTTTPAN